MGLEDVDGLFSLAVLENFYQECVKLYFLDEYSVKTTCFRSLFQLLVQLHFCHLIRNSKAIAF